MAAKLYKFPTKHWPTPKSISDDEGSSKVVPVLSVSQKPSRTILLGLDAAIVFVAMVLGSYFLVTKIPAHTLYQTMPQSIDVISVNRLSDLCGELSNTNSSAAELENCFSSNLIGNDETSTLDMAHLKFTRKDSLVFSTRLTPERTRHDKSGRSLWSLVYYIATPSRVCISGRCSGKHDAGLVVLPMDAASAATAETAVHVRIIPDAVSPADSTHLSWLEEISTTNHPEYAGLTESMLNSFWDAPPHLPDVDRGLFFARSGQSRLHQAVNWFRDAAKPHHTNFVLFLIALLVVRSVYAMRTRNEGAAK